MERVIGRPIRRMESRAWRLSRLAYTAFCAVLIPTYLASYGPTNFVYFCDEALLLTLVGIWLRSPLLVSMAAVGIAVPQALWVADFLSTMAGHPLLGMTAYMFDADKSVFLRALSGFHGWLPFFLVFAVVTVGYDRRAVVAWTALASASVAASFLFLPGPTAHAGATPVNVDYVWGLSDVAAQSWMPAWAWLSLLLLGMPLLCTLPAHAAFSRLHASASRRAAATS